MYFFPETYIRAGMVVHADLHDEQVVLAHLLALRSVDAAVGHVLRRLHLCAHCQQLDGTCSQQLLRHCAGGWESENCRLVWEKLLVNNSKTRIHSVKFSEFYAIGMLGNAKTYVVPRNRDLWKSKMLCGRRKIDPLASEAMSLIYLQLKVHVLRNEIPSLIGICSFQYVGRISGEAAQTLLQCNKRPALAKLAENFRKFAYPVVLVSLIQKT